MCVFVCVCSYSFSPFDMVSGVPKWPDSVFFREVSVLDGFTGVFLSMPGVTLARTKV